MKNLELQKCILGPVYTNCYLLKNKETGELIIVDPADCPEKIEMKISRMNGKPVAILLTHGHFDHILAAQAVKEKYNIPIYACRQEEEMLREPSINMTVHYGQGCSIVPDVFLEDLDVIRLAGFSVQMIHTPGHTKGSCCEAEYDLRFSVERDNDSYIIKYERTENLSKQETEQKGVISADILSKENAGCGIQDAHALRKENKDNIKYALYQLLVKLTGRTLPWGNLTGIRPAKLAMGMIESGMKNTEAAREMRERYLVSPQKTALAITIANREREILKDIDYENGYSLYIGIPFCPSICLYCSFSSYPLKVWEKRTDEYVEALCREVRETALMMKGRKLDTIYIGGGTPTRVRIFTW